MSDTDQDIDRTWAPVARNARQALGLLGYPIAPRCLPGEPGACGGTFAEHTASFLAALKAVADHQLRHIGPQAMMIYAEVYRETEANLDRARPC